VSTSSLDEQLTKYLTDAHSIEQQALAQLKSAPELAGDAALAADFERHLVETEEHERLVRERLAARDASLAKVKDLLATLTGKGFIAFARAQPDTPGKLAVHAFSYEHMELAAYQLLTRVAELAEDEETAAVARRIAGQERAMSERLEAGFDRTIEASLRELGPDDLGATLDSYLADAHAIEVQAIQLLKKGPDLAGTRELATAYEEHLKETAEHERLVQGRLEARGESPSRLKDAALRLGALNWGAFFAAQPDTPAKLAAFAYAFEHLEIGGYEMLRRVADRAADRETAELAEQILAEERAAAERIHMHLDAALQASLEEQGVSAR
jgi:ferritin-like metal-binding protein YciE